MSIEQRETKAGKDRYTVRMRGPDGKARKRTFATLKAAEAYERDQHTQRDRGGWVDPRGGKTKLAEWAIDWQTTIVHLRPNTRRIYADNLRLHILPSLGTVQLGRLDKTMLRKWLANLTATDLAPASVHQAYRTLHRVLSAAVELEVSPRNPLDGIKPPQVEHRDMRHLTAGEVATLADSIDERYRAFVLVAAYCGLRWGELAGLRRHRVDLLHRKIHVAEALGADGKGGRALSPVKTKAGARSVPIPGTVAEALDHHLAHYAGPVPRGHVFTAPEGGTLDASTFRDRYWLPAVAAAGLEHLRVHDLRHTTASLAIGAGADVKVVQSMLGHASAAMTLDRYGHLLPSAAADVAERLDEMARTAISARPDVPTKISRAQNVPTAPARPKRGRSA